MFKHYLQTALRHFRQHKLSTAVNVACLALGLTCFVVAWGFTAYYDKSDYYHERAARTHILTTTESGSNFTMNVSPWLVAEHLRVDFPQLEAVARVFYPQETALTRDGTNSFAQVGYADAEFLHIFDFPFVHGGGREALTKPRSAIVSQDFAQRFFGTDAVVGKTFRLSGRADEVSIVGVVGPIRQPSHMSTTSMSAVKLSFEVMLSMDVNVAAQGPHRWDNNWYFTYVTLPADGSLGAKEFGDRLEAFARRHIPESASTTSQYSVRPVSEFTAINLDSLVGGVSSTLLIKLLGALVLLVAGLNYANLATAQAVTRAKEIAMRRVVGAHRGQVIAQHIVEGFLLTALALGIALLLLSLSIVAIDAEFFSTVVPLFALMPEFWWMVTTLLATVSALAAAYPALMLARVRPAIALRAGKIKGGPRAIATLLVGVQFASASFLIIAVFIMADQHRELKHAIWNPDQDPIVVVANDLRAAGVDARLLKAELLRIPGVKAATGMHRMPWGLGGNAEPLTASETPGATRVSSSFTIVDADVLRALDMKLLAGRAFSDGQASDAANVEAWNRNDFAAGSDFNILVDELTLGFMGFNSAQEAIGKTLFHPTSQNDTTPAQRMHIIGVVEDSAIRPISLGNPSFYMMDTASAVVPVIRIAKQDVPTTLAAIDATWKRLAPEVPLKRRFADEQYEVSYQFLDAINVAFSLLAVFSIVIASMGLVGMALHIIGRRTHEIGVRKTLGATVGQILWLLLGSFSKPVVIAK
jgi:putative ABC transport system permease protein